MKGGAVPERRGDGQAPAVDPAEEALEPARPMPDRRSSGFDRCAARYDELRPVDENWWQLFETLVELGALRGERVLEIGCGTGRLAHALDERALARVWAVDASSEMVARAKSLGVNARLARAEALPFKRGWFDAAVMRMVVHLVDRPRAFAEAARVLSPAGRLVIATEDPASFDDVWFARWFPSVPALERRGSRTRRPFAPNSPRPASPTCESSGSRRRARSHASGPSTSSARRRTRRSSCLPADEYEQGLARAEAEHPEQLEYSFDWLVAVARRPIA